MKIILVFKTHFDIGFTDLASNVIDQYAGSMLEQVIETCKGTQKLGKRHFVWTMPAWPLWHIVNHSEPKLRKELDELIEELEKFENTAEQFYAVRDWDRNKDYYLTLTDVQKAA